MTGSDGTERGGAAVAPQYPNAVLRNRYEIDPGTPLATFSTPDVEAYAAGDRCGPDRRLFALVCSPDLPIRLDALNRLRQSTPLGCLPLIDAGIVDWPLQARRTLAVVYQRPFGGSLAAVLRGPEPIAQHAMAQRVVVPIVNALRGLEAMALTHRAIRPENVFFLDERREDLVLGDCVTAPPGYHQPAAMETIERAMALPGGRGPGTVADDLYALGVTLASLAVGRNLGEETDARTGLAARIRLGSFAALCERETIMPSLTELLRGLLADDARRRWGLDEVEQWIEGARRQQSRGTPVSRPAPFRFRGESYDSIRLLAAALVEAPAEAAGVIRSGELAAWLEKRAQAADKASALREAVIAADAGRSGLAAADDALVARVAGILDPAAPVRYRGFRFMPDGLGGALATTYLRDGDAGTLLDAISLGLTDPPGGETAEDGEALARERGARLRRFLDLPGLGGGLERCLYETNPGLPCQSPLVARSYLLGVEGLLTALDEAAARRPADAAPIDRHIAAFLGARCAGDFGPAFKALNDRRERRSGLAALALLAAFHQSRDAAPVPHLAAWFAELLDGMVEEIRSRTLREDVRRRLPGIVRKGRLKELLTLLDDSRRRHLDARGARVAAAEYAAASAHIRHDQAIAAAEIGRFTPLAWRTAAAISLTVGVGLAWASLLFRAF